MNHAAAWRIVVVLSTAALTAGCGGASGAAGGRSGPLTDPAIKPQVVSTDPPANSRGPYAGSAGSAGVMTIRFNKMMDLSSLRKATRLVDDGDRHPLDIELTSITGDVVFVKPHSAPSNNIGAIYTLTIDTTAKDVNGNLLGEPFTFTFEPEPVFRVVAVSPRDGATDVPPLSDQMLTVSFNSDIDSTIVRDITVVPAIAGLWRLADPRTISHPLRGVIDAGTTYAMTIEGGAHDRNGNRLSGSFSSSFSTAPFGVASSLPANGSEGILPSSTITIVPNAPIDTGSVRASWSIDPSVAGSFLLDPGEIVYVPGAGLLPATRYTVRIDTTLRSAAGHHSHLPFVLSFTTAR